MRVLGQFFTYLVPIQFKEGAEYVNNNLRTFIIFIVDHVTIKNSTHNEIFKLILKIFFGKHGSHPSEPQILRFELIKVGFTSPWLEPGIVERPFSLK